jgi:hypothetical protein
MVANRVWNTEWLAENAIRSYPLLDGATKISANAEFKLPDSALLDLCLTVSDDSLNRVNNFYVSAVAYYAGGLVLTFSCGDDTLGVASVPLASHSYADSYPVIQPDGQGYCGSVVLGNLAELQQQPMGVWSYTVDGGRIQPRCVIPTFRNGLGVRVDDGESVSDLLKGIVSLRPGPNVSLIVDPITNTLHINAVGNSEYTDDCICDEDRDYGDPIRTFNGIGPDGEGNFTVSPGGACLSIDAAPEGHGVVIEDTCAEPCCGCADIDIVNSALQTLRDKLITLGAQTNALNNLAMQTFVTISSSPLSGAGGVED